ncbi:endonuclease domain-containing protein [Agrobacterium vitis]|uniref:endonuclease domain-containing protein n=1 Tax=Agrobacterium vitis TaxID=373 RepID=UPI00403EE84F
MTRSQDEDGFRQFGENMPEIMDRFYDAFVNLPKGWAGELHARASRAKNDEMEAVPVIVRSRILQEIDAIMHLCESPIEQTAIYQLAGKKFSAPWDEQRFCAVLSSVPQDWPAGIASVIVPQVNVGPYRIDFLIHQRSGRRFGVECDGEMFHEKERDAKRDEYLKAEHGIRTFRVTGKEIFRGDIWAETIAFVVGSEAI